MATVILGIPTGDGKVDATTMLAACSPLTAGSPHRCAEPLVNMGDKCYAHAELLVSAYQNRDRFTHLCILHADVGPPSGFLSVMLDAMEQHNLDGLGCLIPMKMPGDEQLYSCGADIGSSGWMQFTKQNTVDLPPTFTADDVPGAKQLVVNTGCLLLKVDERLTGVRSLRYETAIRWGETVQLREAPEDHHLSRQLAAAGYRLGITKTFRCRHRRSGYTE